MQVYPEEHQGREQKQIIPGLLLECFQQVIPPHQQDQRENMGPGQPVKSRGNDDEENDQDIGKNVPSPGAQRPEEQRIGKRNQEYEEKNDTGESESPMKQGHDHFGQPLMGGPCGRWGMEGEDIVVRNAERLQYIFSRPYVITGVRIVQEDGPRIKG
jgi:hypothetical protein